MLISQHSRGDPAGSYGKCEDGDKYPWCTAAASRGRCKPDAGILGNNTPEQRSERQMPSRKDAVRGVNAHGFDGTRKSDRYYGKLGGTADCSYSS